MTSSAVATALVQVAARRDMRGVYGRTCPSGADRLLPGVRSPVHQARMGCLSPDGEHHNGEHDRATVAITVTSTERVATKTPPTPASTPFTRVRTAPPRRPGDAAGAGKAAARAWR